MTQLRPLVWRLCPKPKDGFEWQKAKLRSKLASSIPGVFFRSSLMAWWRTIDNRTPRMVDAEAVRADLWKVAREVTTEGDVVSRAACQASLNANLGVLHRLDDVSIEWFGAGRLSSSRSGRRVSSGVLDRRRQEKVRQLVLLDQISFAKSLTEQQGMAALWWAKEYPDKLNFLVDGSFRQLLELQPREDDYSLSEASDEAAIIVREFLSQASDPDIRRQMAAPLKVLSEWITSRPIS